jgi:uncharacterized membrane protein YqhA
MRACLSSACDGDHRHHLGRAAAYIEGNPGSGRAGFTEQGVMWQVLIHITFILSAIGIAFVDRLSDMAARNHE